MLARVALAVPMVVVLLTLVFVLMRVAPGDPIQAAVGGKVPAHELDVLRRQAGLDKPLLTQYLDYLGNAARGNFGTTLTDHRKLSSILAENGTATLELSIVGFVIGAFVGLPLGTLAGRFRDTPFDVGTRLFGIVAYAMPVFFVGLILQLVFSQAYNILPPSGQASPLVQYTLAEHTHILVLDAIIDRNWSALWDVLRHLVLPAVSLGLLLAGVFTRLVRVNVIQTLRGDYIEAARARGVPERLILLRHAFRNALVPVVAVMGLQGALLLSGAVLVEQTFNWPGIGSQLIYYLNNRDYIGVQGIMSIFALAVIAVSTLIDLVSAWIDPRARF